MRPGFSGDGIRIAVAVRSGGGIAYRSYFDRAQAIACLRPPFSTRYGLNLPQYVVRVVDHRGEFLDRFRADLDVVPDLPPKMYGRPVTSLPSES